MKTSVITGSLGVLALLGSSLGMAATVTVTSSNLNPVVGDFFTITVSATDFVNIGGGTLNWSWNTGVATIQHLLTNVACAACLPVAGPMSSLGSIVQLRAPTWDVLPVVALGGAFEVARFSFLAANAGALTFSVTDDGGVSTGWFDNTTADPVATSYVQANIVVSAVPAPAAVWLLGTGLAGLMVRSARRSRAAA